MSLFQWILHVQLVSVLVFTATHVFAQDVHLTCPAVWANTQPVTLTCEVSKTSITNKCVTSTNTTVFNVNSGTKCTVSPAGYASCLSSSPQSPAINTCWCQENSTYYTFVYYFNADKAQNNGTWTCDKACRDGGGIANPLQITNGPGCVGVQVVDPQTPPSNGSSTDATPTTDLTDSSSTPPETTSTRSSTPPETTSTTDKTDNDAISPSDLGMIVGLSFLGIVMVTVCIVCVVAHRRRRKKKKRPRESNDPNRMPQENNNDKQYDKTTHI